MAKKKQQTMPYARSNGEDTITLETLMEFNRGQDIRLKAELQSYMGRPFVRLFTDHPNEGVKKAVTVRKHEIRFVVRALLEAAHKMGAELDGPPKPVTPIPPMVRPPGSEHLVPPWEDLPEDKPASEPQPSVRFVEDDVPVSRDAEKLLAALKDAPGGLTRTQVAELFSRNKTHDQLNVILKELLANGLVCRTKDASAGGRPAVRWFYGRTPPHERTAMSVRDIIADLNARGINLSLRHDPETKMPLVCWNDPKGVMTTDDRVLLGYYEIEVIAFLQTEMQPNDSSYEKVMKNGAPKERTAGDRPLTLWPAGLVTCPVPGCDKVPLKVHPGSVHVNAGGIVTGIDATGASVSTDREPEGHGVLIHILFFGECGHVFALQFHLQRDGTTVMEVTPVGIAGVDGAMMPPIWHEP